MSNLPSPFKSPKGEAKYMAAYEASMRLWTVPYEVMNISSRFGSTYLVVCGPKDAPPLVLLHCFFTSLASWAYNMPDFSRHYRVYALDMMGQPGKSIPDQPITNREEMADWLTGTLDTLGIKKADLAGYSYGGFAALNYAIHAPDRIKKLVLLSPAGGLIPLKAQFFIRGVLNSIAGSFVPSLTKFSMKSFFHWMFYQPNFQNDEKFRKMYDCMLNQMSLGTKYFRLSRSMVPPLPFKDEELCSVKIPTLLLIGQQEALYNPVAAVKHAEQLISNIKTEIIPQASHDLPVSKSDMVDKRVLEFLKE